MACGAAYGAYQGLRAAGFRPRWETPPPASGAEPADGADVPVDAALPAERPVQAPPLRRVTPLPPPVAAAVPFARIAFDTLPDGSRPDHGTPASSEWASLGATFSFTSYTASGETPHLLDPSAYLTPEAGLGALALGSPFSRDGVEVGVIHISFAAPPRRAALTVAGASLISRFDVRGWRRGERLPESALRVSEVGVFQPRPHQAFRADRFVIETPAGIDSITVDGWGPPQHFLLVDNLEFGDPP